MLNHGNVPIDFLYSAKNVDIFDVNVASKSFVKARRKKIDELQGKQAIRPHCDKRLRGF